MDFAIYPDNCVYGKRSVRILVYLVAIEFGYGVIPGLRLFAPRLLTRSRSRKPRRLRLVLDPCAAIGGTSLCPGALNTNAQTASLVASSGEGSGAALPS
jgi:hypothetical protein